MSRYNNSNSAFIDNNHNIYDVVMLATPTGGIVTTVSNTIVLTTNVSTFTTSNAAAKSMMVSIVDAASGNAALVTTFHNADNQNFGSAISGLMTGGVAQLLNQAGTLDRQKETSFDNIPSVGIATGTTQLAGPSINAVSTSAALVGNSTVGNTQSIIVNPFAVNNRGANNFFQPGCNVLVDGGNANQEYIYVTATTPATNTITGMFTKGHIAAVTLSTYLYNQSRDATIPDGSMPTGIAASAEYLFNATSNTVEFQRSAAGELDGATGAGTSIATVYEYNSGGPANSVNSPSKFQYDRGRNVQGKGILSTTLATAAASQATSVNVASAAIANTLIGGTQIIIDRAGANQESAYVSSTYVSGTSNVALQSTLGYLHAAGAVVEWDIFSSSGPGINGFNGVGIGIEEEAVFNPGDNKFYIERAATADGVSGNNLVIESVGLYNGSTFDRLSGNSSVGVFTATKYIGANTVSGELNQVITYSPAVTASAYAANACVGGVANVSLFRSTAQPTGALTQIQAMFANAAIVPTATVGFSCYIFSKMPNGTYTDKSAITISNADFYTLLTPPFVLTFAAPQGSNCGIASKTFTPPIPIKNTDTSVNTNIYVTLVSNAAFTPAHITDLSITVQGTQD